MPSQVRTDSLHYIEKCRSMRSLHSKDSPVPGQGARGASPKFETIGLMK